MEFTNKLETMVSGWVKNLPHLPVAGQKWLAENVWWIALIGAIVSGIGVLFGLVGLLFGGVGASFVYVIDPTLATWLVVASFVSLAFSAVRGLLLALAVTPLKAIQKKGWTYLFYTWLLQALAVVVGAVLSLSAFGFISGILLGAIGVAITGYFLFEIHGQFVHVVTKAKVTKTAKKA